MFSAFLFVVFFFLGCASLLGMVVLAVIALVRRLPGDVPRRPGSRESRERSDNKHGRGASARRSSSSSSSSGGGGSDDDGDSDGDGGSDGGDGGD
jgi:hypothetical protein